MNRLFLAALTLLSNALFADDLTLVTLDPGHFHAALIQREMLPGIADEAFVYAPLGPDLNAHLSRIAQYNSQPEKPTTWRLRVYTGSDFEERMLSERRGQIVIISGRNRGKINHLLACVNAGLNVLADKPWIIEAEDLPQLKTVLDIADSRHVIVCDTMTQRFEITCLLQRALVSDEDVFGKPVAGTLDEPAVSVTSLHYLLKVVSGVPNLRPPWFFDTAEQGEGLTDVGTHLADLVPWTLFPEQAIDHRTDIQMLRGKRWPTTLTLAEFRRVTSANTFPDGIQTHTKDGRLDYFCNNSVDYTLCGLHIRLETRWDFIAPPGKQDTEVAIFRGSRSRIERRQDAAEHERAEVYVVPNQAEDRAALLTAIQQRVATLQATWPGLAVEEQPGRFRVLIPDRLRVGHEAHFALVAQHFLSLVRNHQALPAWEKANMLAKYYVTTKGVALARQASAKP